MSRAKRDCVAIFLESPRAPPAVDTHLTSLAESTDCLKNAASHPDNPIATRHRAASRRPERVPHRSSLTRVLHGKQRTRYPSIVFDRKSPAYMDSILHPNIQWRICRRCREMGLRRIFFQLRPLVRPNTSGTKDPYSRVARYCHPYPKAYWHGAPRSCGTNQEAHVYPYRASTEWPAFVRVCALHRELNR